MTGLRDVAEATPSLRSAEQANDVLLTLDDALDRIVVLTSMVGVMKRALLSLLEPEDAAKLDEMAEALRHVDSSEERIRHTATRSRMHGKDRLDDFVKQLAENKQGEWIPPRGTARRSDNKRVPSGMRVVEIDPDGRVWTQTPDRPDDPLDGRY